MPVVPSDLAQVPSRRLLPTVRLRRDNTLSFGDSQHERHANHSLALDLSGVPHRPTVASRDLRAVCSVRSGQRGRSDGEPYLGVSAHGCPVIGCLRAQLSHETL